MNPLLTNEVQSLHPGPQVLSDLARKASFLSLSAPGIYMPCTPGTLFTCCTPSREKKQRLRGRTDVVLNPCSATYKQNDLGQVVYPLRLITLICKTDEKSLAHRVRGENMSRIHV